MPRTFGLLSLRNVFLLSVGAAGLLVLCTSARAACDSPHFAAAPSYTQLQYARAVAVADLNGDAIADVVIVSDSANKISVMLGDGSGGFTPAGSFATGGHPGSIAVGDFNNDSKTDVVTTNYGTGDLSIFQGDGAGGFAGAVNIPLSIYGPSIVVVGNFNGDLNQDLAVAYFDGRISILPGNGSGGFGAPTQFMSADRPVAMAVGDFNLDGNLDLVVVTQFGDKAWILFGNGLGGFGSPTGFTAGSETTHVAVGDFNNDGKSDLAVSVYANKLAVLLNNGDGSFTSATIYGVAGSTPTAGVAVGDFNNDGKRDVAVGNVTGVSVRFGDGAGGFGAEMTYIAGFGTTALASDDFNSDGSSDLVVIGYSSSSLVLLINDGAGAFSTAPRYAAGMNPNSVVRGDFNNDGKLDLAVANRISNDVSIFLGDGAAGLSAARNFSVGPPPTSNVTNGPYALAAADFNNDGKLDLVTANFTGASVSILLGDGAGNFPLPQKISLNGGPWGVVVADFNGDSRPDLVVTCDGFFDKISVLFGDGAGNFGAPVVLPTVQGPRPVAVGDFNGDSKPDLAVGNQTGSSVSIFLNNGSGGFGPAVNYPLQYPSEVQSIAVADFNGDGKADLVTANHFSNNIALFVGNGTGGFAAAVYFDVGTGPTGVVAADFNGDGLTDVAVANNGSSNVSILLGNGTGGFSSPTSYDSGYISSVTTGDFNSDGKVDVATDGVGVLVNTCGNTASTPLPKLTISDISVSEETGSASFSVVLSAASAQAVSVQYYTSGQSAVSGADFQQVSGTLNFLPGETVKPIVVPLINDSLNEFNESFSLNLHHPVNASIKKRQGLGLITDSDPQPTISISGVAANEGDTGTTSFIFSVGLSSPSGKLVTVNYSTADGTANAGSDYQSAVNKVRNIPAGSSSATITVAVNGDFSIEPDETFLVNLSSPVNATIATAQATGLIVNDDAPGSLHFNATSYSVNESAGPATVTVTRTGGVAGTVTIDYATSDGTAKQRTDYTLTAGTLSFASGETSKTISVLISDNLYVDSDRTLNLTLSNPTGGASLSAPLAAVLTIADNDVAPPTTNPLDNSDAQFFVRQHYYDFLSRVPDPSGFSFWTGQITQCGSDQTCVRTKRIDVSNAFFYELEYQQTGSYVERLYRAAFGNNQPFPNPFPDPNHPNEEKKVVSYQAFVQDRARVIGGSSLAQSQLDLANAFVLRPDFLTKYSVSLDGPGFVDAVLATIKNDIGVDLGSQRTALINLFNSGGRGAVLYRSADDNAQTNPINNRPFIDAEYNRAFVATQYFGYLRRDADMAGFLFWLGQVSSAPLRDVPKQHAMVCSFVTSAEYQQRFSPVVTHTNGECPQ